MSYYTDFKLRAVNTQGEPISLPPVGRLGRYEWEAYDDGSMAPDDSITCDGTTWYNHEDDMAALSMQYPHTVFILDGEGEKQGDVWRMFFLAGKSFTWKQPPPEPPAFSPEILAKLSGPVG